MYVMPFDDLDQLDAHECIQTHISEWLKDHGGNYAIVLRRAIVTHEYLKHGRTARTKVFSSGAKIEFDDPNIAMLFKLTVL